MKAPVGIAVALVFLACQSPDPRIVVTAGRGAVTDTAAIHIMRVSVAAATANYSGKAVAAGAGHRYVLVDCRIAVPVDSVDFEDFQLVRDRAVLGYETNVGDHEDDDYFYWSYLDGSGRPTTTVPIGTGAVAARLAFKIPAGAAGGYLFYWGLYWGPFDFR